MSTRQVTLPRPRRILPGFGLSLGYTMMYLSLLVLIPLTVLIIKTAMLPGDLVWQTLTDAHVVSAFKVTLVCSAMAAVVSALFGLIIAWVLVRYRFFGRRFFDAVIDMPFALPTAVAGLTFSHLYMPTGWLGRWGLTFTGTNAGIVIVLIFVGFPFVVRTIQPVLQEWQIENEQAAASLGASRWTTFWRIVWPEIRPAFLTGFALAFARAVGEYGSVIFIAANKPGESQIVPLQIVTRLMESETNQQANVIAAALLAVSLVVLLAINGLEWWSRRHIERAAAIL